MRRRMAYRLALQALKKAGTPRRSGGSPAGQGARTGGALGAGAGAGHSAVLPARLLPVPPRPGARATRTWRHTAIDTHSASVTARRRPAADRAGAARALRIAAARGRAGLPDLRARPHAAQERGNHHPALRNEFRRDPVLPILIGDDVFIRGVRRGIEQGEYVYRRGELLFGPGDPRPASRSTNRRWFSPWPTPAGRHLAAPAGRLPRNRKSGGEGFVQPAGGTPPAAWWRSRRPLWAQGSSAAAATRPAERRGPAQGSPGAGMGTGARQGCIQAIGTLTIRMFEAGDAFRLMGAVGRRAGRRQDRDHRRAATKPATAGHSSWNSAGRRWTHSR